LPIAAGQLGTDAVVLGTVIVALEQRN